MPYTQPTAHLGQPITGVSLILILRAFTSGSMPSLTGVEAISNSAFLKNLQDQKCSFNPSLSCQHFGAMFRNHLPQLVDMVLDPMQE